MSGREGVSGATPMTTVSADGLAPFGGSAAGTSRSVGASGRTPVARTSGSVGASPNVSALASGCVAAPAGGPDREKRARRRRGNGPSSRRPRRRSSPGR
ncbi:hypothetical protein ACFQE7_08300 [Nonomuraea ferruginea]|uniref:hypothetical protein n=1 Tax=Nonomuraea ferruginea TaxID=46174 RepID=UPI003623876C